MNREELQEVVKQLEALESLAMLFNSLWFEQIRRDITDSKVQAYLMVFEDAFPNLNHVIEFARKSADVLTDGSPDREHWSRLQKEFESLRLLLGGEEQVGPLGDTEFSTRVKEALGAVGQSALFVEADTAPASGAGVGQGDIDALFENASDSVDGADEQDELQMVDDDDPLWMAAMEEEAAIEAAGALEEEVELTAAEDGESSDDLMDLLGKGDEADLLEDLLEEEGPDDGAETEDDELEALLEEEDDEGDDDHGLLEEDGADEGAGISDEEMSALLKVDDGEEEESEEGKAASTAAEVEAESDDPESKSQDEIDALFG